MAIDAGTVELTALPNISQFGSVLSSGVLKQLGPVEDLLKNNLGKVAAVGIGAALFEIGKASVEAFQEREEVLIKFQNTLEGMPALANATIKPFQDQATALQNLTGVQDEEIISADEVLGRFGLTADQIRELTPLVLDYAAKTGGDVVTSASNLGRALLGNARALKAIGINFKATGDRTKDFQTILEALQSHVGGLAEEFGQTLPGQINILKAQVNDMEEAFGAVLVPVLLDVSHVVLAVLGPALKVLAANAGLVTEAILGFLAFKGVVAVLGLVADALIAVGTSASLAAAEGILKFQAALVAMAPEIAVIVAAAYLLEKAFAAVYEEAVRGTDEIERNASTIANSAAYLDKGRASAENFAIAYDQLGQTAERTGSSLEPRTAEFESLTGAFESGNISAQQYATGLKRLGFTAHQVAGFIELGRKEATDLGTALDDTTPSIRSFAKATDALSADAIKAADATFKLWQAELQLAGGIESVVVDQRAQQQAEADLAKARRHLAALEEKGVTSGKKYRDAQAAVADATDASIQAHLALAGAVDSVIQTQIDNGKTMQQAIGYYKKVARQAGLTGDEIHKNVQTFREDTNQVSGLNDQLDKIPADVGTTYSFKFSPGTEKHLRQLGGYNLSPGAGSGFGEVKHHQAGGWVMHPEIAAIAEKEPELIIPKSKLEAAASGGSNVHVTVGVDPKTGNIRAYVDNRISSERSYQEARGRMQR